MTSASDLPFGSKSEPPLPPPIGRVVREFLRICSKPRNLITPSFTLGCGIELDAIAAVDLHLAFIIGPSDTEFDHALRLDKAFKHACLLIFRMLRNYWFKAFENLKNGLQEFRLVAITLFDLCVYALDVLVSEHILPLRDSWVINKTVSF